PPKLLRYTHALSPRARGINSLSGLEATAEVTADWCPTSSTVREACPAVGRAHVLAGLGPGLGAIGVRMFGFPLRRASFWARGRMVGSEGAIREPSEIPRAASLTPSP